MFPVTTPEIEQYYVMEMINRVANEYAKELMKDERLVRKVNEDGMTKITVYFPVVEI